MPRQDLPGGFHGRPRARPELTRSASVAAETAPAEFVDPHFENRNSPTGQSVPPWLHEKKPLMSVPLLDLRPQYEAIKGDVDAAVSRVVRAQSFVLGPEVDALEEEIASYIGVQHAIGCASGTDALLLTLKALGLSVGDEVIVPAFTFFATAGAVWNAGFRPVFL